MQELADRGRRDDSVRAVIQRPADLGAQRRLIELVVGGKRRNQHRQNSLRKFHRASLLISELFSNFYFLFSQFYFLFRKVKNGLPGAERGLVAAKLLAAPVPPRSSHRAGHPQVMPQAARRGALGAKLRRLRAHLVMPTGTSPLHD